jgi:hypothetical protein
MNRIARGLTLRPLIVLTAIAIAMLVVVMVGCSARPPYRTLLLESPPTEADCPAQFENARWDDARGLKNAEAETARVQAVIQADLAGAKKAGKPSPCWENSLETHPARIDQPEYNLFSVEFDDQGWLANSSTGHVPEKTQMTLLMDSLNQMTRDGHPLHLVIFVHGWHHSARPDDRNVISFRRLLEHAAVAEKGLCVVRREKFQTYDQFPKAGVCEDNEAVPPWLEKRRVVGIYLGWRGDSITGDYIEDLSIWDRKLAAEAVALGSVQELFSRIHSFYQEHDCHTEQSRHRWLGDLDTCVDVRLLTAGHSFGGLITYRALAPRLMMGIVETDTAHLPTTTQQPVGGSHPSSAYAVGFGDLTVLINPAFEATRFEALAEAAVERHYVEPDPALNRRAQLPVLIVATSKTDDATGTAFPLFRRVSTPLEWPPGAERSPNIHTIGWEKRYWTHSITVDSGNNACGTTSEMSFVQRLQAEAQWSEQQRKTQYAHFDDATLAYCDSLTLAKAGTWRVLDGGAQPPPFMPIWNVQADKSVIDGHNDFLNDHFVDFIRQVYYTILRDGDDQMDEMRTHSQQRRQAAAP